MQIIKYKYIIYYFWITLSMVMHGISEETDGNTVEQALDYVFQLQASNCGDLVIGDVLPLQFDVTVWDRYADPAIRTANLLSKVLQKNHGKLDSLDDEMFFFMVRNNVHGDSPIFGAALGLERGVYSKYDMFAPYAYKSNGTVLSHDLSINYDYLDPDREWYNSPKVKDRTDVTRVTDGIKYRLDNDSLSEVEEVYPLAKISDGHWTNPYYDCGGGEVWMVTYSAPIMQIDNGVTIFRGVATIDTELTNIDINQCDSDDSASLSGLDIFRGTHKCQPTTTCVPQRGKGFVPGTYHCVCDEGFYFPSLTSKIRAFTGKEIENWIRSTGSVENSKFQCNACAAGCDTCNDDSPCLHQRNEGLLISLLILNTVTMGGIICLALTTYLYRHEMAMKSASPIFLELMCLGGVLMCAQFFMTYPSVTTLTCSVRIWSLHLGFFILYGSLVLKTWRISMIFTVGTHKRVRLPDKVLLQRFGLLILLVVAVLSAWNFSQMPQIKTLRTESDLKFYICDFGPWQYAIIGVQIKFLLYGVYLCFTVRKAPAHFNESRHITWAVYNAIILGSFMSFMTPLFISVVGPDYMLLFQFTQIQVYATVTLLIIFGPKLFAIKRNIEIEPLTRNIPSQQTIQTVTGRVKKNQVTPLPNVLKEHKTTQTTWDVDNRTVPSYYQGPIIGPIQK